MYQDDSALGEGSRVPTGSVVKSGTTFIGNGMRMKFETPPSVQAKSRYATAFYLFHQTSGEWVVVRACSFLTANRLNS